MGNPEILYKVIALYLLDLSETPLSNAAICEFFVSGNYTDYFNALSVINNLGESGLIDTKSTGNITLHTINEKGRETLKPLLDRISTEIHNEIESYLRLNDVSFKDTKSLSALYDKAPFGGYMVHLKATEHDNPIIDLQFHVSSEVQAKSICNNWKNSYEGFYEIILDYFL